MLDRDQLRAKLASGQPFKLVMVASDFGFRTKHIPGSLHVKKGGDLSSLGKDDDIVVYCSDVGCRASLAVLERLLRRGFTRISHYAGGLTDWEEAGLPLEGDWAPAAPQRGTEAP